MRAVEAHWTGLALGVPIRQGAAVAMITLATAGGVRAADAATAPAAVEALVVTVTPSAWLKAQPKPAFREGHTLPPLTRFGWTLDFDTRVELAESWGYALEFGGYVTFGSVKRLDDPASIESKLVALTASDPKRYPLALICSRDLPPNDAVPAETWTRDAEGKLLDGQAKSMDGTEWHTGMQPIYSPEAPDTVWAEAGRLRADPIRSIREKCPVAIILNGGEYGLGVLGFAQRVWERDPRILAAKGETPWYDYISARKARAETLIADAVRAAAPDRLLYVYYTTSGGTHRNRYGGWKAWAHGYEWMRGVSDLPSSESYFKHFNTGWTGDNNVLIQLLNARGFEIANGQPLAYNWLCAGWTRDKAGKETAHLSDIARYKGFLACCYTAGMIGGNAGYYAYPLGGFAASFAADQPPHWLLQMTALAEAHARFSHLEAFLRDGDLLPGPAPHVWSKDQPAYEFPCGDATVRVLVRKRKASAEWLVTAWAADGDDRAVTVTVPELGAFEVMARSAGGVYHASLHEGRVQLLPK